MGKTWIIENTWNCSDCDTKGILGRHKNCPNCGSPREKGEMKMHCDKTAAPVTDPALLDLAHAGADWFCPHCNAGNKGNGNTCSSCGAPRYEEPTVTPPALKSPVTPKKNPAPYSRPTAPVFTREEVQGVFGDKKGKYKKQLIFGAIALVGILLSGFLVWACQTHEVEGKVVSQSWGHTAMLQQWTQITVREWEHRTMEAREVPPIEGEHERAGMEKIFGSCRDEHYEDERYVCGSHQECTPRTRSESYDCGTTYSDNGNGFTTASTRTCTRTVPDGETCRSVNDYCTRPIYKSKCDYRTQEWKVIQSIPISGSGSVITWKDPVVEGDGQRIRYKVDYDIVLSYHDRGKDKSHAFNPVGKNDAANRATVEAMDNQYLPWKAGSAVLMQVNNLGGVRDVVLK